jgi:hypothetical protein
MEIFSPWMLLVAVVVLFFELHRIHDRLERTEGMLGRLLDHMNVGFGVVLEPSEEVRRLAAEPGSQIEAIKAYRRQTGLGLKPAKAVVDGLASSDRADA